MFREIMPSISNQDSEPAATYDPAAIFQEDGPFNPHFMHEAIRSLLRALPLDPAEPPAWSDRRMLSALLAITALHPRDEIEVMLGVQAVCAYHAATTCWHLGMNHQRPNGDSTRHLAAAASASRTFDTLLKALERRQAKPLTVPPGRPAPRIWPEQNPGTIISDLAERCRRGESGSPAGRSGEAGPQPNWSPADGAFADEFCERQRVEKENEGLDIANTEGILPG